MKWQQYSYLVIVMIAGLTGEAEAMRMFTCGTQPSYGVGSLCSGTAPTMNGQNLVVDKGPTYAIEELIVGSEPVNLTNNVVVYTSPNYGVSYLQGGKSAGVITSPSISFLSPLYSQKLSYGQATSPLYQDSRGKGRGYGLGNSFPKTAYYSHHPRKNRVLGAKSKMLEIVSKSG